MKDITEASNQNISMPVYDTMGYQTMQQQHHVQNRENIASLKSDIHNIKSHIEKLTNNMDRLNIDLTEIRTKQAFIINDIETIKQFINNAKNITESIATLRNSFSKLENSVNSHVDISNNNFSKVNHDIVEIRSQLHHLPSIYAVKSVKSIGEYIKMAPGIIAIITVLLSGLVLYLKDMLP